LASCGGKEPLQGETQIEHGTAQNSQVQEETEATEQTTKTEADDLLNQFFAGEIEADGNDLYYEDSFYVSDLPIDVEDWQSYSIGERIDLDNDGENEQILYGPYGGMYLDASDGKVKIFASGEGTAMCLSYVLYKDETWIVYSDDTHVGRRCHFLEKYSGADSVVETTSFEMYYDEESATYYVSGREVSKSVYKEDYETFFDDYFDYDEWLEEVQEEEETVTETDYSGVYTDTQGTDDIYNELILVKREDGAYNFAIGLYRLTTIAGKATQNGDNLHFVGSEGNENAIEGNIVISGESATVTFIDDTWPHIEYSDGCVFPSGKTEIDELPENYLDIYYMYEWKE